MSKIITTDEYPANLIYDLYQIKVQPTKEINDLLNTCMRKMKYEEACTLILRYAKGFTRVKIAEKLGVTQNCAIGIEKRALRSLRNPALCVKLYKEVKAVAEREV